MDCRDPDAASKPPHGRRMKARAPPPPQVPEPAPRRIFRNAVPDGGGTGCSDAKENLLRPSADVQLTLPQGQRTNITVDGSKALMDLLVELCSRHHLNPAMHTLELLSPEGHQLGFKPNAPLGSLDVERVIIREKVWEDKVLRRPAPKVPEKTVRLVVNYHRSQKAVLRVNPLLPLRSLVAAICNKCEFDPVHVLLLKDGVTHHELPLDKSLAQLGIKELYVHDQSLVLQPKMASAPALNYSESVRSSTLSVAGAEKKGVLGIFSFNRRKSKTEETKMDAIGPEDQLTQNTAAHSDGPSVASIGPCVEVRPSTLGQSQSAMNISRMSPKMEPKKRRAPVPPGATQRHGSLDGYQMGLALESQQRKRKAPAPPPTPSSVTPGPEDTTFTSATPTPDSPATRMPTAASRTKVASSAAAFQASPKLAVQPSPVLSLTSIPSSPAPSSTTVDSLAVQDSSSELSHSMDDSDADLDPSSSVCSAITTSSSNTSDTMSMSTPVGHQPIVTSSTMEESGQASSGADQSEREGAAASFSRSETESAINLKMEEVENNRHSAIAWLHSLPRSGAPGTQELDPNVPEEETLSVGSSGGSSSLPDQGYAASEGMAEDSGLVRSPWDTHPVSPDGGVCLDVSCGGGGGRVGGRPPGPIQDVSSDSDEGCDTWGSRHRPIDMKEKSGRVKDTNDELTAQLHKTLADFEADLEVISHMDIVSMKETPYTLSTDSSDVPVSVVDMDVPVTAIDEVLEDYQDTIPDKQAKTLTQTQPTDIECPTMCQQSSVEAHNKNNNAITTGGHNKGNGVNTQGKPRAVKSTNSLENIKSGSDMNQAEKTVKTADKKIEEKTVNIQKTVKEEKQRTSRVKSDVAVQNQSQNTQITPASVKSNTLISKEKKPCFPPKNQKTVSSEDKEEVEDILSYRIHLNSAVSHSKITQSALSRFGMKTFTVVPPKHSVPLASAGKPAVALTLGAIKIDEQGNMVKAGAWQKPAPCVSSELGIKSSEGSPLLGKAKAFWSSSERHDSRANQSEGLNKKHLESTNDPQTTHAMVSETVAKSSKTENPKKHRGTVYEHTWKSATNIKVEEKVRDQVKEAAEVEKEVHQEKGRKASVIEDTHQPSNKSPPAAPPLANQHGNLSFLKPTRRTSSQYVASAISKYTPRSSVKADSILSIPESSALPKTQSFGQQKGVQSIQVNPHQITRSPLAENEHFNVGTGSYPLGQRRSMSQPEYISGRPKGVEERSQEWGGLNNSSITESSKSVKSKAVNMKPFRPISPTQANVTSTDNRSNIKHIKVESASPTGRSVNQPTSTEQAASFNTTSHEKTNTNIEVSTLASHPVLATTPEPSVTISSGGVIPEPPKATLFGPVKRFRPIISKSVEKETSLHSILMDAIQTRGGKDRLKKISGASPVSLKKPTYGEEENERSALLAAIRAQSSSGRLRKTKSEAAEELQSCRKAAGRQEEESRPSPHIPAPASFLAPPPVSPPPAFRPPAIPPPPSPPAPPCTVRPGGDAQKDPALAREAMMEAIRSGAAADRLKKVTAPVKTLQVNGRLGTIRATSLQLPQQ